MTLKKREFTPESGSVGTYDEDSISGAPPWHEPKLAFMDVRALSHPSIQYSLPYLKGVGQELDTSVVLALLDVTLFLEDG